MRLRNRQLKAETILEYQLNTHDKLLLSISFCRQKIGKLNSSSSQLHFSDTLLFVSLCLSRHWSLFQNLYTDLTSRLWKCHKNVLKFDFNFWLGTLVSVDYYENDFITVLYFFSYFYEVKKFLKNMSRKYFFYETF